MGKLIQEGALRLWAFWYQRNFDWQVRRAVSRKTVVVEIRRKD